MMAALLMVMDMMETMEMLSERSVLLSDISQLFGRDAVLYVELLHLHFQ